MKYALIFLLAGTTLSGCLSRSMYESNPVKVPTNVGTVTCQLYTKDKVWWDEALAYPTAMTEEQADEVCVTAGHKLAQS